MYSQAHLTSLDKFHQVGRHGLRPSWSLFVAVIVEPLYIQAYVHRANKEHSFATKKVCLKIASVSRKMCSL